jgi:hypothetical protein
LAAFGDTFNALIEHGVSLDSVVGVEDSLEVPPAAVN